MNNPNWQTNIEITVPFHDVDVMGVCWHGHYTKYLEIARCHLMKNLDYDVEDMHASGYMWPIIELFIRYAKPLHYGQTINVLVTIVEYEERLKLKYEITDKASGERLTKAHSIQVAIRTEDKEMCFSSPNILLEKLGVTA